MIHDPSLALWTKVLISLKERPRANDPATQVVSEVLQLYDRDIAGIALRLQQGIVRVRELVETRITDERKLGPYRKLLDRLTRVLSPHTIGVNWATYSADIISADMIDTIALLDAELALEAPRQDTFGAVRKRLDELRAEVVREGGFNPSVQSLVVGQLDLLDRSFARMDIDGLTSFTESVFCAVGRLEFKLKVDAELSDDKAAQVRSVIDDLLRIAGLVEVGAKGMEAIPFLRSAVALITHQPDS